MGKIFKFHTDVDTDQIIASQYLLFPDHRRNENTYLRVSRSGFCIQSTARRFCSRLLRISAAVLPESRRQVS